MMQMFYVIDFSDEVFSLNTLRTIVSAAVLLLFIFSRHIAGLNANRAKNIIEWREKNGPFINREQLKKVKGLGPKSFQQCAGFIRINQDYIRTFCR